MADLWKPVSGVFWSTPPLMPSFGWIESLGNAPFFTTIIGALAGAFAGAWAAQRIARKSRRRDELSAEIRVINAGITLGLTIVNSSISSKLQYIKPAKDQYDSERERFISFSETNSGGGEIKVAFNLIRFPLTAIPAEHLQQLVLQQGSTFALRAVLALVDTNSILSEAIALRNEWLEKFQKKEIPHGFTYPDVYFGLAAAGGRHDQFGTTLKAIYAYNDDIIFYSIKLCEYLRIHGEELKKELKKISGEKIGIIQVDTAKAVESGMLPTASDYEDWDRGYSEVRVSDKKGNWKIWLKE